MSTAVAGARRLVAIALTDADVLLAGSDLSHVADAVTEVDVLVARHDPPGPLTGTSPMDAEDYPDDDDLDIEGGPVTGAPLTGDPVTGGYAIDPSGVGVSGSGVPGAGAASGPGSARPVGPRLHRLGLRQTVQDRDEPDLVAAMCELVGFDPDDRVFLLAPAVGPGAVTDPEVAVALRAVRRVARVYGLPVLQYRRACAEPDRRAGVEPDRRAGAEPGPAVEQQAPLACGS